MADPISCPADTSWYINTMDNKNRDHCFLGISFDIPQSHVFELMFV